VSGLGLLPLAILARLQTQRVPDGVKGVNHSQEACLYLYSAIASSASLLALSTVWRGMPGRRPWANSVALPALLLVLNASGLRMLLPPPSSTLQVTVATAASTASLFIWHSLVHAFPASFTAAEVLVLAQALSLSCMAAVVRCVVQADWLPRVDETTAVLLCMVWGMVLICWGGTRTRNWHVGAMKGHSLKPRDRQRDSRSSQEIQSAALVAPVVLGVCLVVMVMVPLWCEYCSHLSSRFTGEDLPRNPLLWVLHFLLLQSHQRQAMLLKWLVLVLIAVPLVRFFSKASYTFPGRFPHILLRKGFHVLVVLMFLPSVFTERQAVQLSLGGAACVFVFLELLRVLQIEPFASTLEGLMMPLTDSRDSGILYTSHFALLIGISAPVWLQPLEDRDVPYGAHTSLGKVLAPFAGLISVGIGDSAASLAGVYLGRTKLIRGAPKSAEGTLGGFAGMMAGCYYVSRLACRLNQGYSCAFPAGEWLWVAACSLLSALLEATTTQNDNVFVPLAYMSLLSC